MKKHWLPLILVPMTITAHSANVAANEPTQHACEAHLSFTAPKLHSPDDIDFCQQFTGQLLLVVNTASHCGFTPQFEQLESLYNKYKNQGLAIVGFPSNDFDQESGSDKAIAEVCYVNYGVTFPMVTESSVKGSDANTFFQFLIDTSGQAPQWNFNKYLITQAGNTVTHFNVSTPPLNSPLEAAIVQALEK